MCRTWPPVRCYKAPRRLPRPRPTSSAPRRPSMPLNSRPTASRCAGSGSTRFREVRNRRTRCIAGAAPRRWRWCHAVTGRLPSTSKRDYRLTAGGLSDLEGRTVMKATHWMIAAAAFAFVQPASAGVDDTEVIIYRFPGVRDNNINPSEVTVFHCTNFSGATETLHMVTRGLNGGLVTNVAFGIGYLITLTASTRQNNAFISTVTFD